MDTLQWHVGDVVRKLRFSRNWTQVQLAKKASLDKGTISEFEREAKNYTRETLETIANAFGLTPATLIALVPEKKSLGSDLLRHQGAVESTHPTYGGGVGASDSSRLFAQERATSAQVLAAVIEAATHLLARAERQRPADGEAPPTPPRAAGGAGRARGRNR